jgi:hypothetical protein
MTLTICHINEMNQCTASRFMIILNVKREGVPFPRFAATVQSFTLSEALTVPENTLSIFCLIFLTTNPQVMKDLLRVLGVDIEYPQRLTLTLREFNSSMTGSNHTLVCRLAIFLIERPEK